MSKSKRYKHSTCKQEGGNDGYCYVVRCKHTGRIIIDGLTRSETAYYRDRYEQKCNDGYLPMPCR